MDKNIRVLDLFSGCGGLSFGFAKEGFKVVAGVDNWKESLETFEKNHPGAKGIVMDLGNFSPKSIAQVVGDIDIVIGGPPCQGFSISGKRNPNDPRNQLYGGFLKTVEYFKPTAFILENVPNILSMSGGKIKDSILKSFEKLGYNISYKILLASDYGVPQNRRRVFFVGLRNGNKFEFPEPTHGEGKEKKVTAKDAIGDLPEDSVVDGEKYSKMPFSKFQELVRGKSQGIYNHETIKHSDQTKFIINMVPDGGNYKDLPEKYRDTRKVNIAWTRLSSNKPSFTIDTGHNHHFHYGYNRVPTARESARIQSFDDNFIFCGNKNSQIKQIGNAVPPLLARCVAKQLKKYL